MIALWSNFRRKQIHNSNKGYIIIIAEFIRVAKRKFKVFPVTRRVCIIHINSYPVLQMRTQAYPTNTLLNGEAKSRDFNRYPPRPQVQSNIHPNCPKAKPFSLTESGCPE